MKTTIFFCILALYWSSSIFGLSPSAYAADEQVCIGAFGCKETCDCYWSADCSGTNTCDYGSGCTHSGKKDGTCSSSSSPVGPIDSTHLGTIAVATDLWFSAYENPTSKEGLPDAEKVREVSEMHLAGSDQQRIKSAVFNAMDVALGFDFTHPPVSCLEYDERCVGIFRIHPDKEGFELLRVVRAGFNQGILQRDSRVVADAVYNYWGGRSQFRPHHTGRCYPHGHSEFGKRSTAECQADELSRILSGLLTKRVREEIY